jgi:peptidyl-prolyl cis-trans isomerase C
VKKTSMILMALALTATLAAAQDKPAAAATAAPQKTADPVVASAGTVAIHQAEFENALKTLPEQYQAYAAGPGKKQFAEDYLKMKLLAAEGYKAGLEKQQDVVEQLSLMRDNLVANAELQQIEKSVTLSDDDLKKAYEANKKDYEQVKARHILIAFKGSPAAQPGKPALTDEQAKAKAEDIRKQLVAGADFGELAKKESDDTGTGARGGDLGSFGHNQMVPEFEEAAFNGKVGEISPVVKTQYGYHIIKVESREITPFDQVKPALDKSLRQKQVQTTVDKLKDGAKFDDVYFAAPKTEAAPATAAPATATPADAKKTDGKKPTTKKPTTK